MKEFFKMEVKQLNQTHEYLRNLKAYYKKQGNIFKNIGEIEANSLKIFPQYGFGNYYIDLITHNLTPKIDKISNHYKVLWEELLNLHKKLKDVGNLIKINKEMYLQEYKSKKKSETKNTLEENELYRDVIIKYRKFNLYVQMIIFFSIKKYAEIMSLQVDETFRSLENSHLKIFIKYGKDLVNNKDLSNNANFYSFNEEDKIFENVEIKKVLNKDIGSGKKEVEKSKDITVFNNIKQENMFTLQDKETKETNETNSKKFDSNLKYNAEKKENLNKSKSRIEPSNANITLSIDINNNTKNDIKVQSNKSMQQTSNNRTVLITGNDRTSSNKSDNDISKINEEDDMEDC